MEAESGEQALELLSRNPDVSLLFTDVVMPQMKCHQLAQDALRRKPGLKVLIRPATPATQSCIMGYWTRA